MGAVRHDSRRRMELGPTKIEQDIARVRAIEPDRDVPGRLIALPDIETQVVPDVVDPMRPMYRERLRYPRSIEAVSAAHNTQGGQENQHPPIIPRISKPVSALANGYGRGWRSRRVPSRASEIVPPPTHT